MMTVLILVKHAMPDIDPAVPPPRWLLGAAGRYAAFQLSNELRQYDPSVVITSIEPKAAETGEIVGACLHAPVEQRLNLHEHERDGLPFLSDAGFHARIATIFAHPDERVVGRESANEARSRFSRAVHQTLDDYSGDVVIVAHGTVLSLFVSGCTGIDGFDLWKRLGLPSYVVLERPGLELISIIDSVELLEPS